MTKRMSEDRDAKQMSMTGEAGERVRDFGLLKGVQLASVERRNKPSRQSVRSTEIKSAH